MKKIFLLGVMLIMCLGIFAGCGPKKHGDLYTLREAYEKELITVEDLKNIAYYLNETSDEADFVPLAKTPETLSEETKAAIEETMAYNLRHKHQIKNANVDLVWLKKYLGTYHGYVAVTINEGYRISTGVFYTDNIGGVAIRYMMDDPIYIWKGFKEE